MLTELQQAQNSYASITARLKKEGLSGKEIGFLKNILAKAKETLRQAHVNVAEAVTAQPILPEPKTESLSEPEEHRRHAPFHFYAIPGSQQAAVLIDRIYTQWLTFHTFKRAQSATRLQEYRTIIEGVVSNLLYASATLKPGVFVARGEGVLAKTSRYRPSVYNQKLLTVLDDLHAMGLIEQVKGERIKRNPFTQQLQTKVNLRTQLHTTQAFEDLRATYNTTRPTDVLFQTEQQEVVILKKDETSSLLEYTDEEQPQAVKYRKQMQIINGRLANAGNLLKGEVPGIDQRQRFLVRKFTYGSLESGGRLWGGFWQNMSKRDRTEHLRIGGQSTVELDYSSIIAHLAYIVAGVEAPEGDLYHIPGLSSAWRPVIKKLLPALLFRTKPTTRYPKDVLKDLPETEPVKPFGQVFELIKARHPGIAHLFGTGEGHFLQYLESQLMVNVLLYCDRARVTALPIHDCIIVAKDNEFIGRCMMDLACMRVLGRLIPVK